MSDAEQPIPELYREAAEQVRQLARQARLTDIRDDLLGLAAKFERLAAYGDAAIHLGLPGTHTVKLFRERVISRHRKQASNHFGDREPNCATGMMPKLAALKPRWPAVAFSSQPRNCFCTSCTIFC